jgi:phosphoglycolate phosphatase
MLETKLIIFDLDGTLVDSRQDIVNGINFMLKEMNLDEKPFDEIISYVGRGVEELIKDSIGRENFQLRAKALDIFKIYYKAHPADNARTYPGVKDTLGYFDGKDKAVITNRNHNSSITILEKMGIAGFFKSIIGDDNTSCLKPSRCQFDRLFEELDVRDRQKVLMVGDMDIDVLAGKASGIATCAVTYGIGKRQDIEHVMPDYIIDDICELKKIIKQ